REEEEEHANPGGNRQQRQEKAIADLEPRRRLAADVIPQVGLEQRELDPAKHYVIANIEAGQDEKPQQPAALRGVLVPFRRRRPRKPPTARGGPPPPRQAQPRPSALPGPASLDALFPPMLASDAALVKRFVVTAPNS